MNKDKILVGIFCASIIIGLIIIGVRFPFTNEVIVTNGSAYDQKIDSIAFGYCVEQPFAPKKRGLSSISIYVNTTECAVDKGKLRFSIWNQQDELIFNHDILLSELPQYGWYEVELGMSLSKDELYRLVLECLDSVDFGPQISFIEADLGATPEEDMFTLSYAGKEIPNSALRVKYLYKEPVKWFVYIVYIVFALIVFTWVKGIYGNGVSKRGKEI